MIVRLGISIFCVIASAFIIIPLLGQYDPADLRGFSILVRALELPAFLMWAGAGYRWAALGCILGYILAVYFTIMGIERLFRKMQISSRKGMIIIGSAMLAISIFLVFSVIFRAQRNEKKAQLHIKYLSPKIKNDERFKNVRMYAHPSGKLMISGVVKNQSELFDLTEAVFSSNPPVKVEWYMSYGPGETIIWEHELKDHRLKWQEKLNKIK